jgi:hypothetical protein
MAVTEFFAGIAVGDYESALPWYERFMGKAPDFFPRMARLFGGSSSTPGSTSSSRITKALVGATARRC